MSTVKFYIYQQIWFLSCLVQGNEVDHIEQEANCELNKIKLKEKKCRLCASLPKISFASR